LKTTPHLPKLSIKLELKPEHYNPAFYENNQPEDEDEEDGIAEDDLDGDGSTSHMSEQSTTQSEQLGTMAPTAVAGVGAGAAGGANSTVTPIIGKTMVKKSSTTKSPAPPTVGRKATSYIAVST